MRKDTCRWTLLTPLSNCEKGPPVGALLSSGFSIFCYDLIFFCDFQNGVAMIEWELSDNEIQRKLNFDQILNFFMLALYIEHGGGCFNFLANT